MNGRQLLLDTLMKKRTDRVPVSPFIYNNVVNEKNNGEPADPIAACAQLYRKFGFDIILRNYTFGDVWDEDRLSCDTWRVEKETVGEIGNIWNEQTTITTPERTLTQVRSFRKVTPNIVVSATGRYFIQSPEDFEQFVKYQPPIGEADLSVISHAREVVAGDGVACTWIQGAFNYVERYRGLQALLTDPYDDEDFYDEMMDYFGSRNLEMTRQLVAAGSDLICIEANMATGTMAGPRMFGDYIMEREERLIGFIHKEGCYAMYHNCGDGKGLMPLIDQMSMDIYESLTPPPFGDTIDDSEYSTADAAVERLRGHDFSSIIVCVAGWVPTHAVIRVIDQFRHLPMVLWGMCGWIENGHIVTTAEQAGTTALRPAMEEMGYTFKYVYSIIGEPEPISQIDSYVRAAYAAKCLRHARVGTMGYRDMLLYGTQYEGNSMRGQIGVEVEPFEMLEMVQNTEALDPSKIAEGVKYVRENWKIMGECADSIIETGVKYALAIGKKIEERGYKAVTLIDVDGMKKLCGFPPAIVFMLLERWYGVLTTPENDVMGNVTELMLHYLTGQTTWYMEYYEFFKDSMLIGTPDYVPVPVVDGDVKLLPAAFGLLNTALMSVSEVKTGYVTCARLIYKKMAAMPCISTPRKRKSRPSGTNSAGAIPRRSCPACGYILTPALCPSLRRRSPASMSSSAMATNRARWKSCAACWTSTL